MGNTLNNGKTKSQPIPTNMELKNLCISLQWEEMPKRVQKQLRCLAIQLSINVLGYQF